MDSNKLALVTDKELSLVDDNSLNAEQLKHLLKRTPAQYKKTRPAKGGGEWVYVSGGYMKKVLNLMFGWDWDFEIIEDKILLEAKEVIVKGRLTCRSNGKEIVKMQYGNKDIIFRVEWKDGNKTQTNIPLSIGNDMKAAATDALKKCAAELGIASDVYNAEEFKEIIVTTEDDTLSILQGLFMEKEELISPEDKPFIERIIKNKETASYKKAIKLLESL